MKTRRVPVIIVRPGIENGGDMHHVLNPVEHHRVIGILGETDEALHAQELRAVA